MASKTLCTMIGFLAYLCMASCTTSESFSLTISDGGSFSTNYEVKRGQKIVGIISQQEDGQRLEIRSGNFEYIRTPFLNTYLLVGFYWDKRLIALDKEGPFEFSYTPNESDSIGVHTIECRYDDGSRKLNASVNLYVTE